MFPLQPTINIDDAIKQANLRIKAPMLTIMIAFIIAGIFSGTLGDHSILANCVTVFFIAGTFVFGILFSLIATTKWRIWAFSHVNNVHELQAIAEQENILPRKGSWQWKLAIESKADKEKLGALAQRFKESHKHLEDDTIPEAVNIYAYNIIRTLMGATVIAIGFYSWVYHSAGPRAWWLFNICVHTGIAIIPIGLTAFTIYKSQNIKHGRPDVTLSDAGIETPTLGFKPWSELYHERMEVDYSTGKYSTKIIYLAFEHNDDTERIDVTIASERRRRIYYLLKIYRNRYNKNRREQKNVDREMRQKGH